MAAEVADAYAIGDLTTYLVRGPPGLLKTLQGLSEVAIAEVDGVVHTNAYYSVQPGSTWGLERISQPANSPASPQFDYAFPSSAGTGVDIYVVDSGIRPWLAEFQGRACIGYSAFGTVAHYQCQGAAAGWSGSGPTPPGIDDQGHGTHVAGTCASSTYGVAKAASIIAVQVFSSARQTTNNDLLNGLQYTYSRHNSKYGSGTGSVVNLSLGGSYSATVNSWVRQMVNGGLVVVVAAGNSNADAYYYSPASEPSVLTVGAATIYDTRTYFSNYGSLVDVFAPGERVWSVGLDGSASNLSSTSMASPHVAGLAALLMSSTDGLVAGMTSAQIQDYIKSKAVGMQNYSATMINTGCSMTTGCPAAA